MQNEMTPENKAALEEFESAIAYNPHILSYSAKQYIRAALTSAPEVDFDALYNIVRAKYKSAQLISDRVELWLYKNDTRKAGDNGVKIVEGG